MSAVQRVRFKLMWQARHGFTPQDFFFYAALALSPGLSPAKRERGVPCYIARGRGLHFASLSLSLSLSLSGSLSLFHVLHLVSSLPLCGREAGREGNSHERVHQRRPKRIS